jgi:hypothetical protein
MLLLGAVSFVKVKHPRAVLHFVAAEQEIIDASCFSFDVVLIEHCLFEGTPPSTTTASTSNKYATNTQLIRN